MKELESLCGMIGSIHPLLFFTAELRTALRAAQAVGR
jgi:hypothetical protein